MKKRILSVLTALALVLTLVHPSAMALGSELSSDPIVAGGDVQAVHQIEEDFTDTDNEILFDYYIWQLLYSEIEVPSSIGDFGTSDSSKLSAAQKTLYNLMRTHIEAVAAGTETSTKIQITEDTENFAEILTILTGMKTTEDYSEVTSALIADLPASLYWWNRLSGLSGTTTAPILSLGVDKKFAGNGDYVVDNTKVTTANNAIKNASEIIERHKSEDDYNKILSYKKEICKLVTYNWDALNSSWVDDESPWHIINVFDGDSTTNVVCEGYSKAFQYLCDNSQLSSAKCYTVTGEMDGGTGAGPHMWNIVTMENGKNYLVDVTNCDLGTINITNGSGNPAGSIDAGTAVPEGTERLFLVGGVPANNTYTVTQAPFSFKASDGTTYTLPESTITYAYDEETTGLYPEAILTLATEDYSVTQKKNLTVSAAPTVSDVTYSPNLTLSGVTLNTTGASVVEADNSGQTVEGNWAWKTPNQPVGNAGSKTFKAVFTPNNQETYNSVECDVSFTVNKAKIDVSNLTWSTTTKFNYDGEPHTVSITNLPSGVNVEYEYTKGDPIRESAPTYVGTYAVEATLTLDDSANYELNHGTTGGKNTCQLTISPVDQNPQAVNGSLTKGGSTLDLKTLIPGAKGQISFTLGEQSLATLNGDILTSGNTTGTVTVNYSIATGDVNGDNVAEYNAYPSGTVTVEIVDKQTQKLTVTQTGMTYGGTLAAPGYTKPAEAGDATITYTGTLRNGTSYANSTQKPTEAGEYTVAVKCESDSTIYTGTASFTIAPLDIGSAVITLGTALTYDNNQQTQTVGSVAVGGKALTAVTDYTVSDNTGTNAGTYTLKITAVDTSNYTGTATKQFTIAKASTTVGVTPGTVNVKVNGTANFNVAVTGLGAPLTTPAVTVSANAAVQCTVGSVAGNAFPVTVTGKQATAAGGVTLTVTYPGDSNYDSSTATVTVVVTEKDPQLVAFSGLTLDNGKLSKEFGSGTYPSVAAVTTPSTGGGAITYSSSNPAVATIANDGTVTVVGRGTTTITAVAAPVGDYAEGIASYELTVTAKAVTPTVTVPGTYTYTGSAQTPDPEVKAGDVALVKGTDYTVEYADNTNAGTATVTVKPVADSNYTWAEAGVTGSFVIGKATGTKTASVYVKNDGTAKTTNLAALIPADEPGTAAYAVTSTAVNLEDVTVAADGTLTLASKTGENAPAADSTETVTVEVTGLTNYETITITVTATFTEKDVVDLVVNPAADLTYDGTEKAVTIADAPEGEYTYHYTGTTAAGEDYSSETAPKGAGTYTVNVAFTSETAIGTGSASFTIAPKAVTVTGKTLTITEGGAIPSPLYDIAGLAAGDTLVPAPVASCEATSSSPAGTYPITVTGDEVSADGNYTITYVNGTLTIEAAVIPEPPVIHVTGVSLDQNVLHLTVGGTAQLVASVAPGNAGNRNVTWSSSEPAVAAVSGGAVTALRPGSAVITVTTVDGGYAASCAVTVTAPVTPPVNPGNPGGGYPTTPVTPVVPNTPSNPGSSNNNNNNSSTNNPGDSAPSTPSNSSVAPEATVSGGTASAVVSGDMASQLVDQAASGVSTVVIAPEISGSVNRTEVSIPASAVSGIAGGSSAALKVETPAANITISNSGLASLGGQDVTIAAEKTGGTVSVEITAGGQTVSSVTGGLKVEIPADCGPGTVAQLVDENGNVLSTLRKSYASGQTMNVPLEGSAKVIFVDNGKSFADVPAGNWAANAVAFASGHELMNGVSASSFSPAEPMTRGMLAVVLHNLEGNPGASYSGSFGDVGGNDWYAQAVQWAADNSIVTGVSDGVFAPNASITREQLVVMLYRYAGEPNAGGSLTGFSDSANVSSWARQAMAWAVSSGIVGGSNGALNPQSGATRAEVAQMLMNFVTTGEI